MTLISSTEPPEKHVPSSHPRPAGLTNERMRVYLAELTQLVTDARDEGFDEIAHLALLVATMIRARLNDTRPDNMPPSAPHKPNTGT